MTIISTHEKVLLKAGAARAQSLEMLHRSGRADAELLQRLVGQRCRFQERLYKIASVSYGFGGFITAKGYRIQDDGNHVSKKLWNIGALTPDLFEGL
jgi:hypothetical protein